MAKSRTLNLLDIFKYKKDLCWGKNYFGYFERGKLICYILFSDYYETSAISQILKVESDYGSIEDNVLIDLIENFRRVYSQKKIKYFIRELNESTEAHELKILHDLGFQRINRNFYYEYIAAQKTFSGAVESNLNIVCKEASMNDIEKIVDIDRNSQLLEFRDYFCKAKSYFINNMDNVFVFANAANTSQIYGFANKKEDMSEETFEFTFQKNLTNIIPECIEAFEETYIKFYKNQIFRFTINESHKAIFSDLKENYHLLGSTQILLAEASPRKKFGFKIPNLFPRTVPG